MDSGWSNLTLDFNVTENIATSGVTNSSDNKISVEVTMFPVNGSESATLTAWASFGGRTESQEVDVTFLANSSATVFPSPKLEYVALTNRTAHVHDTRSFILNITHTEGISEHNISVTAGTPLSLNLSMGVNHWGENFCCRNSSILLQKAVPSSGNFTDKDVVHWELHLANTGVGRRTFWRRRPTYEDDRVSLILNVTVTDIESTINGTVTPFTMKIGSTDINDNLTILANSNDRPYLDMQVESLRGNASVDCSHNSSLSLKVTFSFFNGTRAAAKDVKAMIVVPFHLKLTSISNSTGTEMLLSPQAGSNTSFTFSFPALHKTSMNATFIANFTLDKRRAFLADFGVINFTLPFATTYSRAGKGNFRGHESYRQEKNFTMIMNNTWPLSNLSNSSNSHVNLSSNCGMANNSLPGRSGWTCGTQPGPAHLELCLGNSTRFGEVRLYNSTVTQFRLEFFNQTWKSDGVLYNATYNSTGNSTNVSHVLIPNGWGRKIRLIPTNSSTSGLFRFNMTAAFFGEVQADAYPVNCTKPNTTQHADYASRQYIFSPPVETLFVCMEQKPGTAAKCMATNDKGSTWFHVDEEVANIGISDPKEPNLFGIHRNRISPMMSANGGHTWAVVDDATYATARANASSVRAKTLPFVDWSPANAEDLAPTLGLHHGDTNFSVSNLGVHLLSGGSDTLISLW